MSASNSCFSQQSNVLLKNNLSPSEALTELTRQAKRLQRTAQYGRKTHSLPILRRLIHAQVINHLTLPALYRQREQIQRKYLFRLLAKEAGFDNWEAWRAHIESSPEVNLGLLHSPMKSSYPNLWFATAEEAHNHVTDHGGQVYRYGRHAVVLEDSIQQVSSSFPLRKTDQEHHHSG